MCQQCCCTSQVECFLLYTLSSNSFPLHRIILSNGTENSFLLLFILKWSISAHLNTNGKLDEFYNRKLFCLLLLLLIPFFSFFLPTLKSVCFLSWKELSRCMKKFSRTLSSSSRHCSFHAVNWFIKYPSINPQIITSWTFPMTHINIFGYASSFIDHFCGFMCVFLRSM